VNLEQILEAVYSITRESDRSTAEVTTYVNRALKDAAFQVQMPELKTIDVVTVSASVAYVSLTGLTGGFGGTLRRVNNSTGIAMTMYPTLELLMDAYPTMAEVGDVESVTLEGSTLWYQKIPAIAEVLTVLYYKNPPELSALSDEPSFFPSQVHYKLAVNGAAYLILDEVEEGLDGDKTNTNAQYGHYMRGVTSLKNWLERTKRHYISSVWDK
jgi:hypothetical protein